MDWQGPIPIVFITLETLICMIFDTWQITSYRSVNTRHRPCIHPPIQVSRVLGLIVSATELRWTSPDLRRSTYPWWTCYFLVMTLLTLRILLASRFLPRNAPHIQAGQIPTMREHIVTWTPRIFTCVVIPTLHPATTGSLVGDWPPDDGGLGLEALSSSVRIRNFCRDGMWKRYADTASMKLRPT